MVKGSITIRFLRERGDLRWRAIECVLVSFASTIKVACKSFLYQGLSEPEFYGDLVYKLKTINGSNNFKRNSLRTYVTKNFPCWNIFKTLHTVCFIHGLSIYEIKRICHRACFFSISY